MRSALLIARKIDIVSHVLSSDRFGNGLTRQKNEIVYMSAKIEAEFVTNDESTDNCQAFNKRRRFF